MRRQSFGKRFDLLPYMHGLQRLHHMEVLPAGRLHNAFEFQFIEQGLDQLCGFHHQLPWDRRIRAKVHMMRSGRSSACTSPITDGEIGRQKVMTRREVLNTVEAGPQK